MKKHTIIICLILISIGLSEDKYTFFLYPKINFMSHKLRVIEFSDTIMVYNDDRDSVETLKHPELNFGAFLGFENNKNKFGIDLKFYNTFGLMAIYERLNLLGNLNVHIGGGVYVIFPYSWKYPENEYDNYNDNDPYYVSNGRKYTLEWVDGILRMGVLGVSWDFYPFGTDGKRLIFNYDFYMPDGFSYMDDRSHNFSVSYPLFESKARARGRMPLPPLSGELGIPEKVGNAAIDNFIDTAYELHNKLTNLKDKLANISDDLNKANQVLTEIDNHPNGVLGWGENQIVITFYKALKGPDVNVDANPDIQTILDIFNSSEGEFMEKLLDAVQTGITSNEFSGLTKEKLLSLDIKYDPTEAMREKLVAIKEGLLGSSLTLASIPDDIKDIGVQAKDLFQSSTKLTSEAQSLGLKAPKAIKAIKNTGSLIKEIPNEVSEIGNEANQVIEEVKNVTDSIQGILSSFE